MEPVLTTAKIDTSGLSNAIPLLVQLGRRTAGEQAVTSMGWILVNAQKATDKTEISQIDSELQAISTPVLSTRGKRRGLPLRSGRMNVTTTPRSGAEMIIVSRLHNPAAKPGNKSGQNYNLRTGNRWALAMPGTKGVADFWRWVTAKAKQMISTRHSSTAFLKSGFTAPIRECFNSPLFQHSRKYRSVAGVTRSPNPLNTTDSSKLGLLVVNEAGNDTMVRAENNVGEGSGNSILDERRRHALIVKAGPVLQAEVNAEEYRMQLEIGRRYVDAAAPIQKLL